MRNKNRNTSESPVLPKLAYTAVETCRMLGCSYPTLLRLKKGGLLNPCSGMLKLRFTLNEINRFLNS